MNTRKRNNLHGIRPVLGRLPWLPPQEEQERLGNFCDSLLAGMRKPHLAFSAGLVVDLGNSTQMGVSIAGNVQSGGPPSPSSGAVIGQGIYMGNADTYCNLFLAGCFSSGILKAQVQCAPSDTSGLYTDPTSGLAALPGAFQSGGVLWLNSGGDGGLLGAFVSGQACASGFAVAQGFQRTGLYARVNLLSGNFAAGTTAGFISNLRTTGSGGGYSPSPGSGGVSV